MTVAVLSVNPLFRMRRAAAQMPVLAGLYRAVDAGWAGGTGESLLRPHLHHQETLLLLQVLPTRECGQLSAHPRQLHRADPSQGAYIGRKLLGSGFVRIFSIWILDPAQCQNSLFRDFEASYWKEFSKFVISKEQAKLWVWFFHQLRNKKLTNCQCMCRKYLFIILSLQKNKYSSRVTIPLNPFKTKSSLRKMLPIRRNNFKTRFKGNF